MPIYDYVCASCGQRTEVIHGVNAPGPEHCPHCGGGPMKKALHPPAIHFKGSGWAKKERASSSRQASGSPGAKPASGETAAFAKDGSSGGSGPESAPSGADAPKPASGGAAEA